MILSASSTQAAEMMALVEAMAGMMFFTTPCVSWYVTPCKRRMFRLSVLVGLAEIMVDCFGAASKRVDDRRAWFAAAGQQHSKLQSSRRCAQDSEEDMHALHKAHQPT